MDKRDRNCEQCNKIIKYDKYNRCLWCSHECRDKWMDDVPEKYARVFNDIIKELEEEIEYLSDNMCNVCSDLL